MRILVTAGPTHEYIDDVRFISNPSSGMMGYAIARAAVRRGHAVTLVSGPVALRPPSGVFHVSVTSATEMHRAVLRYFPRCDSLMMTAAVGDFRPRVRVTGKIKKDGRRALNLRLVRTPDILADCGRFRRKEQVLVGFAVESMKPARTPSTMRCGMATRQRGRDGLFQAAIVNARAKLARKKLDFIFLNSPDAFRAKYVTGLLMSASGVTRYVRNVAKSRLATRLVLMAEKLFAPGTASDS
jgi:phosphopantothenoylcysteine synthetase/decarboxylase